MQVGSVFFFFLLFRTDYPNYPKKRNQNKDLKTDIEVLVGIKFQMKNIDTKG